MSNLFAIHILQILVAFKICQMPLGYCYSALVKDLKTDMSCRKQPLTGSLALRIIKKKLKIK